MIIKHVCSGPAASNTYLAGDGRLAVIIDAGAKAEDIFRMVDESGMTPEIVILTHYHYDHIECLNEVREKYGIPAAAHVLDAPKVHDMALNGAFVFGSRKYVAPVENTLEDGQEIVVGDITYRVLHTGGHTSGGICILAGGSLFTGDTLFNGSIGRTDLGDGDYDKLINSIKTKLLTLNGDTVAYPGHGGHFTIRDAGTNNPFLIR